MFLIICTPKRWNGSIIWVRRSPLVSAESRWQRRDLFERTPFGTACAAADVDVTRRARVTYVNRLRSTPSHVRQT
eukprot:1178236-Prorocentrum_minimum.AAC.2